MSADGPAGPLPRPPAKLAQPRPSGARAAVLGLVAMVAFGAVALGLRTVFDAENRRRDAFNDRDALVAQEQFALDAKRAALEEKADALRRVKEALVSFPDPDTGKVKTLFTRRNVRTTEFSMTDAELDFYDALTRYVEDQSIKAATEDSARGRALGFTMAMLQRRFASSVYAVRRSLERMKDKREKILADPEGYRQGQLLKKVPDDFDDLPEDEQQKILEGLEEVVASVDPAALREEIVQLTGLVIELRGESTEFDSAPET